MNLTGKQRRHLRSLGHHVKVTINVGKNGVTENTTVSVENGFNTSELVKVKILDNCPDPKDDAGEKIAGTTQSHLVQILGNTLLFYKPDPDQPSIKLPG